MPGPARLVQQRRIGADHRTGHLRLPEIVDAVAKGLAVVGQDFPLRPGPGLGVQRLTRAGEDIKAGAVVLLDELLAHAHPHAHRGWRGEHVGDAVFLHQFPGDARIGIVGRALAHDLVTAGHERAVGDVGVTDDPADVRRGPPHRVAIDIEEGADDVVDADHVAAVDMNHALWGSGGAGGVEDEQGILGVHLLGCDGVGFVGDQLVEVDLAGIESGARAVVDHDMFHFGAFGDRGIDNRLQRDGLAAPGR